MANFKIPAKASPGTSHDIDANTIAKDGIGRSDLGSSDLARQLAGYSMTTAEILYHLPDHPGLLQAYVWQDYDLHPRFPKLRGFLTFWTKNLDGALNRVRVAHRGLISAREFRFIDGNLIVH